MTDQNKCNLTYLNVCDIISKGFRKDAKGKNWQLTINPKGKNKLELEWYP